MPHHPMKLPLQTRGRYQPTARLRSPMTHQGKIEGITHIALVRLAFRLAKTVQSRCRDRPNRYAQGQGQLHHHVAKRPLTLDDQTNFLAPIARHKIFQSLGQIQVTITNRNHSFHTTLSIDGTDHVITLSSIDTYPTHRRRTRQLSSLLSVKSKSRDCQIPMSHRAKGLSGNSYGSSTDWLFGISHQG